MLLDLHTGFSGASKIIWYSHLFQNFPQFVVIHTVKGFSKINETEVDIFFEFSCFFYDPTDIATILRKLDIYIEKKIFNSIQTKYKTLSSVRRKCKKIFSGSWTRERFQSKDPDSISHKIFKKHKVYFNKEKHYAPQKNPLREWKE